MTGNLEPIARRKLEAAGLDRWFVRSARAGGPVFVGGFGTPPARARAELFARAEERARSAGDVFSGVVYVADTPLDAAAAAAAGVRFVGVATGRHGVDELRAAAPPGSAVLASLADRAAPEALLAGGDG